MLRVALALVAAVLVLAGAAVAGGLAFVKHKKRAQQVECKNELRAAYTAEREYFTAKRQYTENPSQLALQSSLLIFDEASAGPLNAIVLSPLGVRGVCPKCDVTIACAKNIDDDAELDVWSVSTATRKSPKGAEISAGTPFNDFDDLQ